MSNILSTFKSLLYIYLYYFYSPYSKKKKHRIDTTVYVKNLPTYLNMPAYLKLSILNFVDDACCLLGSFRPPN